MMMRTMATSSIDTAATSSSKMMLVVLCILITLQLGPGNVVEGQRVITGLGAKLQDQKKKTGGSGGSSVGGGGAARRRGRNQDSYTKEGEDEMKRSKLRSIWSSWFGSRSDDDGDSDDNDYHNQTNNNPIHVIMGIVVVLATLLWTNYKSLLSRFEQSLSSTPPALASSSSKSSSNGVIGHHGEFFWTFGNWKRRNRDVPLARLTHHHRSIRPTRR